MESKDWWYLIATIVSPFLAAGLSVLGTLLWQRHKESRDAKLNIFSTLMAYRKASPFPSEAVKAFNLIVVVFYGQEKIVTLWHDLFSLYQKKDGAYPAEEINRKLLDLLSAMAKHLGYQDIEQTKIDQWYTPLGAPNLIKVSGPENGATVQVRQEAFGFVHPPYQDVQVLIFARDGKWYPQTPIYRDGPIWKVLCTFGDENTPTGSEYQIVAVAGHQQINRSIGTLPHEALKSPFIYVKR